MLEQLYFERFYLCGQFSNFLPVLLVALLEQQYVAALLLLVAVPLQRGPVQRQLWRLCESKVFSTFATPSTATHLPSSGIKMSLSTSPPRPHLVSASRDISVTDEIRSRSLASNFEPAIRTMLGHRAHTISADELTCQGKRDWILNYRQSAFLLVSIGYSCSRMGNNLIAEYSCAAAASAPTDIHFNECKMAANRTDFSS